MNTNDITEMDVHYNEQLGKYVIYCKHTDGSEDTLYCNFLIVQPLLDYYKQKLLLDAEKQFKSDLNSQVEDDEDEEEYDEDEETEDEQYERHLDEEAESRFEDMRMRSDY